MLLAILRVQSTLAAALTYVSIYLLTNLAGATAHSLPCYTYLPTYLLTYLPTYSFTHSSAYLLGRYAPYVEDGDDRLAQLAQLQVPQIGMPTNLHI